MQVNKAIVDGRAGRDVEVRAAGSSMVANVNLAVSEKFVGRDGAAKEVTNWIPIAAWGDLATELGRARKGDRVFVEGSIASRSYENKDGVKVNVVEVKAKFVQVLAAHGFEENDNAPPDAASPRDRNVRPMRTSRPPAPSGGGGRPPVDDDEPLPF